MSTEWNSFIISHLKRMDAAWLYDGDPSKPHAELTSGLHSNGFFDCLRAFSRPGLCAFLADFLAQELKAQDLGRVDWVVGSAYAAITFSYEVAKSLGAVHGFVEKDPADPKGKRMVWQRMTIPEGSRVLQAEELITTAGTFLEVRRAIQEGNAEPVDFLPVVGALVHRPPKLPVDYGLFKVFALLEIEIQAFKPEECPWCKSGSKALRPKTHWKELTGKS